MSMVILYDTFLNCGASVGWRSQKNYDEQQYDIDDDDDFDEEYDIDDDEEDQFDDDRQPLVDLSLDPNSVPVHM